MDSLFKKAGVQKKLNDSINLATLTVEKGFNLVKTTIKSSQPPYSVTGFKDYYSSAIKTGTATSVSSSEIIPYYKEFAGWLHTHTNIGYTGPSARDVYNIVESGTKSKYYEGDFVVAFNGSKYAMTVTDTTKAKVFLGTMAVNLDTSNFKTGTDIEKAFKECRLHFERQYKKDPNQIHLAYEMALSAVLLRFNSGVTLLKQDASGAFKPIVIKTNKTINKRGKEELTYTIDCLQEI